MTGSTWAARCRAAHCHLSLWSGVARRCEAWDLTNGLKLSAASAESAESAESALSCQVEN